MMWRNTTERYGAAAKGFHWIVAALVIVMIGVGLVMTDLDPTPAKFRIYATHKSVGLLVLALILMRLVWRLLNPRPAEIPSHKKWEKVLARIIHWFFYGALILMPLSGWVMSSAKGFPVSFFGLFTLPDFVPASKDLAETAEEIHEILSNILIVAILLHFAGALKHHIIDKDSTLRRMLPFGKIAIAVIVSAFLYAFPAAACAGETALPQWKIDPAGSVLSFTATQMGAEFKGEFKTFSGDIFFSPFAPETGHARIVIDTGSVSTGSPDRDEALPGKDWFDTSSFPQSAYEIEKFERKEDGTYIAYGNLTIRDIKKPLNLNFTLSFTKDEKGTETAHASGETILNRLDFGVGQGEWTDEKAVGANVTVRVALQAVQKSANP